MPVHSSIALTVALHSESDQWICKIVTKEDSKEKCVHLVQKHVPSDTFKDKVSKLLSKKESFKKASQKACEDLWVCLIGDGALLVYSEASETYDLQISSATGVALFGTFNLSHVKIQTKNFENHASLIAQHFEGACQTALNYHQLVVVNIFDLKAHNFENFGEVRSEAAIDVLMQGNAILEKGVVLSDRFEIHCTGFFRNHVNAKILGLKEGHIVAEGGIESSGDIGALQTLALISQTNIVLQKGVYSAPFLKLSAGLLIDCRFSAEIYSNYPEIIAPLVLNAARLNALPSRGGQYWQWMVQGVNAIAGLSQIVALIKPKSPLAHPYIQRVVRAFSIIQGCKALYDKRQANATSYGLVTDVLGFMNQQILPLAAPSANVTHAIKLSQMLYRLLSRPVTSYEKVLYGTALLQLLEKSSHGTQDRGANTLLRRYTPQILGCMFLMQRSHLNIGEKVKALRSLLCGLFRYHLHTLLTWKRFSFLKPTEPLWHFVLGGGLQSSALKTGLLGLKSLLATCKEGQYLASHRIQEIERWGGSIWTTLQYCLKAKSDIETRNVPSLLLQGFSLLGLKSPNLLRSSAIARQALQQEFTQYGALAVQSDMLMNQNQVSGSAIQVNTRDFRNSVTGDFTGEDVFRVTTKYGINKGNLQVLKGLMHIGARYWKHHGQQSAKTLLFEGDKNCVKLAESSETQADSIQLVECHSVDLEGQIRAEHMDVCSEETTIGHHGQLSATRSIRVQGKKIRHKGQIDVSQGELILRAEGDLLQEKESSTVAKTMQLVAGLRNIQAGQNVCYGKLLEKGGFLLQSGTQVADSLEQKAKHEIHILQEARNTVAGAYDLEADNLRYQGVTQAGSAKIQIKNAMNVEKDSALVSHHDMHVRAGVIKNDGHMGSVNKQAYIVSESSANNTGTIVGSSGLSIRAEQRLVNEGALVSSEGCVVTHSSDLITNEQSVMQGAWGVRNVVKNPVTLQGEQTSEKGTIEVNAPRIHQEKLIQRAVDIEMQAPEITASSDTVRYTSSSLLLRAKKVVDEATSVSLGTVEIDSDTIDLKKKAKVWSQDKVRLKGRDVSQSGSVESVGDIVLESAGILQYDIQNLKARQTLHIRQLNGQTLQVTTPLKVIGGLHYELAVPVATDKPIPTHVTVAAPIQTGGMLSFTTLGGQVKVVPGNMIQSNGFYCRAGAFENLGGIMSQANVEVDVRQADGSCHLQGNIVTKGVPSVSGPSGFIVSLGKIKFRGTEVQNLEGVIWCESDLILDCQKPLQRSGLIYVKEDVYSSNRSSYEMILPAIESKAKAEAQGTVPRFMVGGKALFQQGLSNTGGQFFAARTLYVADGTLYARNLQEFWKGAVRGQILLAVEKSREGALGGWWPETAHLRAELTKEFPYEHPTHLQRLFSGTISAGEGIALHVDSMENRGVVRSPEIQIKAKHFKNQVDTVPHPESIPDRMLPLASLFSENALFKASKEGTYAYAPLASVEIDAAALPVGVGSVSDKSLYHPMIEITLVQSGLQTLLRSGYLDGLPLAPEEAWRQLRQNAQDYLKTLNKPYLSDGDAKAAKMPLLVYQNGSPILIVPESTQSLMQTMHAAATVMQGKKGVIDVDMGENQGRMEFAEALDLKAKQFSLTQLTRLVPSMQRIDTRNLRITVPNTAFLKADHLRGEVEHWCQTGGLVEAGKGGFELVIAKEARFNAVKIAKLIRTEGNFAQPEFIPPVIKSDNFLILDVLDGKLSGTGVILQSSKKATLIAKEDLVLEPASTNYQWAEHGRRRPVFQSRQVTQPPIVSGADVWVRSREGVVKAKGCIFHASHGNIVLQGKRGVEVLPMQISEYVKQEFRGFRGLVYVRASRTEHRITAIPSEFIASGNVYIIGDDPDSHNRLSASKIFAQNYFVKGGFNEIVGSRNQTTITQHQMTIGPSGFFAKAISSLFSKESRRQLPQEIPLWSAAQKLQKSHGKAATAIAGLQLAAESMEALSQAKRFGGKAVLKEQLGLGKAGEKGLNPRIGVQVTKKTSISHTNQNVPFEAQISGTVRVEGRTSHLLGAPRIAAKRIELEQENALLIQGAENTHTQWERVRGMSVATEARNPSSLTIGIEKSNTSSQEAQVMNAVFDAESVYVDTRNGDTVLDGVSIKAKDGYIRSKRILLRSQQDSRYVLHRAGNLSLNIGAHTVSPSLSVERQEERERSTANLTAIKFDQLMLVADTVHLQGACVIAPHLQAVTMAGQSNVIWIIEDQPEEYYQSMRSWSVDVGKKQYFAVPGSFGSDRYERMGVTRTTVITDSEIPGYHANRDLSRTTEILFEDRSSVGFVLPYVSREGRRDLKEWFGIRKRNDDTLVSSANDLQDILQLESKERFEERTLVARDRREDLEERKVKREEQFLAMQEALVNEAVLLVKQEGRQPDRALIQKQMALYLKRYDTKERQVSLAQRLFNENLGFRMYVFERVHKASKGHYAYQPVAAPIVAGPVLIGLAMSWLVMQIVTRVGKEDGLLHNKDSGGKEGVEVPYLGTQSLPLYWMWSERNRKSGTPGFPVEPHTGGVTVFPVERESRNSGRYETPIEPPALRGSKGRVREGSPIGEGPRDSSTVLPMPDLQGIQPYYRKKRGEGRKPGDKSHLGRAWKDQGKVVVKDPKLRYEPIIKHDERGHWEEGSINPIPNFEIGQKLLESAYEASNKKQRFNVYNGKLIKFRADNTGGWHPYVVCPDERKPISEQVPDSILKQMVKDKMISQHQCDRWRKNKE